MSLSSLGVKGAYFKINLFEHFFRAFTNHFTSDVVGKKQQKRRTFYETSVERNYFAIKFASNPQPCYKVGPDFIGTSELAQ